MKDNELTQLKIDAELKWRETREARDIERQNQAEQLQTELDKKRTETEQVLSEAETLELAQVHLDSPAFSSMR